MEEYYKIRYNLYKYFFNIDNDNYSLILNTLMYTILFILMLLSCFFIVLIKTVDLYSISFTLIFIFYLYISYSLITVLSNIEKDEYLQTYKNYYEICNIIYRENKVIDKNIIHSIKNINKIFDSNELNIFINNTINNNDILKYTDLNNFDNTKLFYKQTDIPELFNTFDFIGKSGNKTYILLDKLFDDSTYGNLYKDAQIAVLNYINQKYKKKFKTLYINKNAPELNKYDSYISKINRYIYLFIIFSIYFLIIAFHGLFIRYNYYFIYAYIITIILLLIISFYVFIIMYYSK
jgi:hypothetical protein